MKLKSLQQQQQQFGLKQQIVQADLQLFQAQLQQLHDVISETVRQLDLLKRQQLQCDALPQSVDPALHENRLQFALRLREQRARAEQQRQQLQQQHQIAETRCAELQLQLQVCRDEIRRLDTAVFAETIHQQELQLQQISRRLA